MKIEKFDGSEERSIIAAMISDARVLGRIASRWGDGNLFESDACNTIAEWCVDFFRRYNRAPQHDIRGLFESYARDGFRQSNGEAATIEKLLSGLSDEFATEIDNPDYLIDLTGEYFNRVRLMRLKQSLQGELDRGRLQYAEKLVQAYHRIEIGMGSGIDLLLDEEAVRSTFAEDDHHVLIEFPGPLGAFFGDELQRDGFVAFTAPQKTGKSYWLLALAYQALLCRRRVAWFQVGDMSEKQVKRLLLSRLAVCIVDVPQSISFTRGADNAIVETNERSFDRPLDEKLAWTACIDFLRKKIKTSHSPFRLSCHPVRGITVAGIKDILDEWDATGFQADVVVIDYADNLASVDTRQEQRDQVNDTWERMRALSQIRHCLVLTATQANAREGYNRHTLDRSCFSQDNRKLSHVTGMAGINVHGEEKRHGISRLNWIVLREDENDWQRVVHCAGCLALANPCVKSCF
jgi:hypothetical protein